MSEESPTKLSVQLGSEPDYVIDDRIDYRILSVLTGSNEKPDTYFSTLYMAVYARLKEARRNGEHITLIEAANEVNLRLPISIGGRGRKDLLYADQVDRGIGITPRYELPKPSRWDRVFRRDVVRAYEEQQAENLNLE